MEINGYITQNEIWLKQLIIRMLNRAMGLVSNYSLSNPLCQDSCRL